MIAGYGSKDKLLDSRAARQILEQGLSAVPIDGQKVLVLTPDSTRSGPMPLIFRLLSELIKPRAKKLDYLIALGTHQPMSEDALDKLFGISAADRSGKYAGIDIYNHRWDIPDTFAEIGVIRDDEVERISRGLIRREVRVAINKLILDYDRIILYGPVFPHEVAGFSAGHKYIFPGIAGSDIINFMHWLGGLITNFETIGRKDTPMREVIERAASMVTIPMTGISSVVEGAEDLAGLFAGDVRESWEKAVELSLEIHIKWCDKPYQLIISVMPEMYDDIWTAGKGMYKLEPAAAPGGEVIIYAPHVKEFSYTHGKIIDEIGYHVRDFFMKQWDKYKKYPGGVLAHSTHVKGMGSYENGIEKPRVKVTMATGIPRARCELVNLGYKNPAELDISKYEGREDEGILVVHRAGETLYRLKSQREK